MLLAYIHVDAVSRFIAGLWVDASGFAFEADKPAGSLIVVALGSAFEVHPPFVDFACVDVGFFLTHLQVECATGIHHCLEGGVILQSEC